MAEWSESLRRPECGRLNWWTAAAPDRQVLPRTLIRCWSCREHFTQTGEHAEVTRRRPAEHPVLDGRREP